MRSMDMSKQKIIILTAVIVAVCTLTISYLTYFSQSKIAPELEKTGESIIKTSNNNANNNNNQQQPLTMADLKGKVVLVNFWTYSCINVLRTIPHLIDWNTKYGGDKGLVIVGVHTPEFGFEKNTDFVKTSLQKYGIKYPVIQDNDYKIWNAYGNNYWPRMYLVDDKGVIRYDKVGEGEYNQTEKEIQSLLAERNSNSNNGIKYIDNRNTSFSLDNKKSQFNSTSNNNNDISNFLKQPVDFSKIKTPELYFGNQGSNSAVGNSGGVFEPGQIVTYNLPPTSISNSTIEPNTIYLEGKWKNNHDNLELQSDTGRIVLNYSAQYVNLVAGGTGQGIVHEDNALLSNHSKGVDTANNDSKFVIDYPRLYNIVNHQSYDDEDFHSLVIDVKGKGFQAYAFTFG